MPVYNSTSKKAEEFINDAQIRATLAYAEEHKDDLELMEQILEKGRQYQGLSYKEAATLLECEDPAIIQKIFDLGKEIVQRSHKLLVAAKAFYHTFHIVGHMKGVVGTVTFDETLAVCLEGREILLPATILIFGAS